MIIRAVMKMDAISHKIHHVMTEHAKIDHAMIKHATIDAHVMTEHEMIDHAMTDQAKIGHGERGETQMTTTEGDVGMKTDEEKEIMITITTIESIPEGIMHAIVPYVDALLG